MNTSNNQELLNKYPILFRGKENLQESLMSFGFECGNGWYAILDNLCYLLTCDYEYAKDYYERIKDMEGKPKNSWSTDVYTSEDISVAKEKYESELAKVPKVVQVKEKFGTLRFYVEAATEKHYNFIAFAEVMSGKTCEVCGSYGKTRGGNWLRTLCDIHHEMRGY